MRTYILFSLMALPLLCFSHSITKEIQHNYIETYAPVAIEEMHRSGIPASITLAQGILESNWGQSTLSTNSNNHFGIKCKEYWTGEKYFHKDDDYVDGVLTKSCFRVYEDIYSSYKDHSEFLMANQRYAGLFDLATNDFEAWAKGLKQCGYATDPKYANHLIRIIQDFDLYVYDYAEEEEGVSMAQDKESSVLKWEESELAASYFSEIVSPTNTQTTSVTILSAPTYDISIFKNEEMSTLESRPKEEELIRIQDYRAQMRKKDTGQAVRRMKRSFLVDIASR